MLGGGGKNTGCVEWDVLIRRESTRGLERDVKRRRKVHKMCRMGCWVEVGKCTVCAEWDAGWRWKEHGMCRMGYWVEAGKYTGCVEWDIGWRRESTQDV